MLHERTGLRRSLAHTEGSLCAVCVCLPAARSGTETTIDQCPHTAYGQHNCQAFEQQAIDCFSTIAAAPAHSLTTNSSVAFTQVAAGQQFSVRVSTDSAVQTSALSLAVDCGAPGYGYTSLFPSIAVGAKVSGVSVFTVPPNVFVRDAATLAAAPAAQPQQQHRPAR